MKIQLPEVSQLTLSTLTPVTRDSNQFLDITLGPVTRDCRIDRKGTVCAHRNSSRKVWTRLLMVIQVCDILVITIKPWHIVIINDSESVESFSLEVEAANLMAHKCALKIDEKSKLDWSRRQMGASRVPGSEIGGVYTDYNDIAPDEKICIFKTQF